MGAMLQCSGILFLIWKQLIETPTNVADFSIRFRFRSPSARPHLWAWSLRREYF